MHVITEVATDSPQVALDTVFATGADGKVYEIPAREAARYAVTPQRVRELGHLPIVPYTELERRLVLPPSDEVGGRHRVLLLDGSKGYHTDWLDGTYVWESDGNTYRGLHRHLWGRYDRTAITPQNL